MNTFRIYGSEISSKRCASNATTICIQVDCEGTVVAAVIGQLRVSRINCVNHVNCLGQGNIVNVVTLGFNRPRRCKRGVCCIVDKSVDIPIWDGARFVVIKTADINLCTDCSVCLPHYHVSIFHWSSIAEREITTLRHFSLEQNWVSGWVVTYQWRCTVRDWNDTGRCPVGRRH